MAQNLFGLDVRMSGSSLVVKELNNLGSRITDVENDFTDEDGPIKTIEKRLDSLKTNQGQVFNNLDYSLCQFADGCITYEISKPGGYVTTDNTNRNIDDTRYLTGLNTGRLGNANGSNYGVTVWIYNEGGIFDTTGFIELSIIQDETTAANATPTETTINDSNNPRLYDTIRKEFPAEKPLMSGSVVGFGFGNFVVPSITDLAKWVIKIRTKLDNDGTTKVQLSFKQFEVLNTDTGVLLNALTGQSVTN